MNKKEIEIANIKGKISFLKNDINKHWYSYLIVTQDYKEIKELEKKLEVLENEQKN